MDYVGCYKLSIEIMEEIRNCIKDDSFSGIGSIIDHKIKTAYMNGYAEALRKNGE